MFRFENLEIWKLAIAYADGIYGLIEKIPRIEKFNLTEQLRRAALSISNNIAEGSGAATTKGFKSFLDISVSSTLETVIYYILHRKEDIFRNKKEVSFISKQRLWLRKYALSKTA